MPMLLRRCVLRAAIAGVLAGSAVPLARAHDFLADCTVLIIRHAEKSADGPDLSAPGQGRAQAYAHYFNPFKGEKADLRPDLLIASTDTDTSQGPRLTLEPLAHALGLPIETHFAYHEEKELASFLSTTPHGKTVLIAWHRRDLTKLIRVLGGNPASLLPGGQWPDTVHDWVVELRFDTGGVMNSQRLISENF